MRTSKKKSKMRTSLINLIIDLERLPENVLKNREFIAIKYHNTYSVNDSGLYEIILPYYGGGTPDEWLIWKDKLLKALEGQGISIGTKRHTFTE